MRGPTSDTIVAMLRPSLVVALVGVACAEDEVRRVVTIEFSQSDRDGRVEARSWAIDLQLVTPPGLTVKRELIGPCALVTTDLPYVDRSAREALAGHAMVFASAVDELPVVSTDWRAPLRSGIGCDGHPEACAADWFRVSGYSATEGPFDLAVPISGEALFRSPVGWCEDRDRPLPIAAGEDLTLTWAPSSATGSVEFYFSGYQRGVTGIASLSAYCEFPMAAGRGTVPSALLARVFKPDEAETLDVVTQSATTVRTTTQGGLVTVRLVRRACTQPLAWRPR
jgi:hypothetical protein